MTSPDLLSLILTLRPLHPVAEGPYLGRAAHALFLDAIRWADADLAEQLHAGSELRPFTASDLIGVSRKMGLSPDRTYTLRLTTLTAAASQALLQATRPLARAASPRHLDGDVTGDETLTSDCSPIAYGSDRRVAQPPPPLSLSGRGDGGVGGPLSPGSTLELGQIAFRIEAVDTGPSHISNLRSEILTPKSEILNLTSQISNPKSDISTLQSPIPHHPWAGATTYEALSAPWLLGRITPPRFVKLHFASPTTFKSEGRHVPVPLPHLVFGSLLERWNAFAPVALPPEVRRFADECLALSSYELRSRGVQVKDGGLRMGGQGWARFTATTYDRYWLSLIHLLSEFAFYAGVGAQTTMGFGQCRPVAQA